MQNKCFFCAAYGAGNRCPIGKRIRIVLDVFDQVRRDFRIDPEQTYVTCFSGGGRVACTIGYSLPSYFGGVVPICGTNPLPQLDYLRHRVRDRLSVAFVTGEKDFNREENEKFAYPLLRDFGARSKLVVVKDVGHRIPKAPVLDEVFDWLNKGLEKRRELVKKRPHLRHPPDNRLTPSEQAAHLLNSAELELREKDRAWRGIVTLQGIITRWGKTESAEKAKKFLQKIKHDRAFLELVEQQGGADERTYLFAQASALQEFGRLTVAKGVWETLARRYPKTKEGQQATEKVEQITKRLSSLPYLGIRFVGATNRIEKIILDGPADQASLLPGDRITKLGKTGTRSLLDVRRALKGKKPGDRVKVDLIREGKKLSRQIKLGRLPS